MTAATSRVDSLIFGCLAADTKEVFQIYALSRRIEDIGLSLYSSSHKQRRTAERQIKNTRRIAPFQADCIICIYGTIDEGEIALQGRSDQVFTGWFASAGGFVFTEAQHFANGRLAL